LRIAARLKRGADAADLSGKTGLDDRCAGSLSAGRKAEQGGCRWISKLEPRAIHVE
jgi:hypothetical protein